MLLRLTAVLSAISCALILASSTFGQLSDAFIVTGNMDVEGQVYTVFVEDTAHMLRIDLAGTRCFEALPDWVYPAGDPVRPPVPDQPRFFWERVVNVLDVLNVLARCRP
jgi:hypothetical protein